MRQRATLRRQQSRKGALIAAALLALSACSPVSIEKLGLVDAYRQRNISALWSETPSNSTRIVLQRQNLETTWQHDPDRAITSLRTMTQAGFFAQNLSDQLFALAELSWLRARQTHDRTIFMAAALYAYAYLAPDASVDDRPSPYDAHFRQACDLYMFALTEAFGSPVNVGAQRWQLPFGTLDLSANPTDRQWHGHELTDFRPTARLKIHGLNNIYITPGLGEPLAAIPMMTTGESAAFQITDRERVPVSLFLDLPSAREQILSDTLTGHLFLSAEDEQQAHPAGDVHVPLQYDTTTARAISLSESVDWSAEYRGFLDGQFLDQHHRLRLAAIEPHRLGRMPVVLVHGTASSPGRWADMVNDLLSDPEIRRHYEFWLFSYGTGNPIPYSALQLRESINEAVQSLGGPQADPALAHVTLIGHSQGGLLSKMLVIDAKDLLWDGLLSTPFDKLRLTPDARDLLHEALFPAPMPVVDNVAFISTPQHGSYLATLSVSRVLGRMMTFPLSVTHVMQELVSDNQGLRLDMSAWRVGSVYGMSPESRFIRALAAIPVSEKVEAHSIIPVLGDKPGPDATDGVVEYESAHVPYVNSELVVKHSAHSTQSNPVTIAEVRRILFNRIHRLTGDTPPPGDMEQRNIARIGGLYVPTERPSE
ncbi:hypothetical protein AA0472_1702 [Acetobacter estunensis NRIC 0472]|uniref:Alpha/beta fold hydrolase n=1 Tax=Acetobacter estunensis TaxID=104097 RepID=A0A967B7X1_9PROT|nr:alpha/beta fold hydrolase [Acetobacter estunensis]NHO53701.1 alpha/beta fold hydrolase [Acetobacter estunensis]GBQ25267.1 hypothetical protein AA0472_1702 [Acetobacter estunensis NRIC 0472]